jgi:tetratricopeptide (TPR) repeat protein
MTKNSVSRPAITQLRIAIVLLLFILFSQTSLISDEVWTLEDYLARADSYSQQTWEQGKAIAVLNEALEQYPDNENILWRLSRAYADSAEVLQKIEKADDATVEQHYHIAKDYADRAIEINPQSSMAYTQRAIATGRIALFKGIWSAIDFVKQTRDAVEKALELDETNNIAQFIFARTHAEVSTRPRLIRGPLGLGWANLDIALEHFAIAIELRPDFIMYRLDAARAFVRKNNYERARELLAVVPELENQNRFDDIYRQEAQELYDQIKDR